MSATWCSLSVDCSSPANSCSSSKTQHTCPLLWESFTSLFSQLPGTVSPFSDPSLGSPCSRFPGTALLLQAVGFFAKPQFCYLLHSVWLPTGLHPYLLGALTWIHCCSSYSIISSPWSASHILLCFISPIQTLLHCPFFMFWNLLSLFHFWFSPVVPSPPFSPAPSSCDPRAWRRGEWRLTAGSTAARGHFLPPYGRFRLGSEKSSPSALHLPPPAILLHTSSSAARCSSPSLPSFSLSLSFSGSPEASATLTPQG